MTRCEASDSKLKVISERAMRERSPAVRTVGTRDGEWQELELGADWALGCLEGGRWPVRKRRMGKW